MKLTEKHYKAAKDPCWDHFDTTTRVHGRNPKDWRTYVTEKVRFNWNLYSLSSKCAIVDICQNVADQYEKI